MYTQHWIDDLIVRFHELKQGEPDRTDEDIQGELIQWTLDNENKIYSAFLTLKGRSLFIYLFIYLNNMVYRF
jgi:hypothetical protein